jgi:trk system potassium uptake protein TrkA
MRAFGACAIEISKVNYNDVGSDGGLYEFVELTVGNPGSALTFGDCGISTIATVQWATERVLQRILPERPGVEWIDPSANVCLLERAVPSSWAGRPVAELDLEGAARVASITRLGVAGIPGPSSVVQEGDLVHVSVAGDAVDRFDRHLAAPAVGGGR